MQSLETQTAADTRRRSQTARLIVQPSFPATEWGTKPSILFCLRPSASNPNAQQAVLNGANEKTSRSRTDGRFRIRNGAVRRPLSLARGSAGREGAGLGEGPEQGEPGGARVAAGVQGDPRAAARHLQLARAHPVRA